MCVMRLIIIKSSWTFNNILIICVKLIIIYSMSKDHSPTVNIMPCNTIKLQ